VKRPAKNGREKLDPRVVVEMAVAYLGDLRPEMRELLAPAWSELDRRQDQRRQQGKGTPVARRGKQRRDAAIFEVVKRRVADIKRCNPSATPPEIAEKLSAKGVQVDLVRDDEVDRIVVERVGPKLVRRALHELGMADASRGRTGSRAAPSAS